MSKVIWEFADDISTDIIYPGRFMATVLPSETPEFAFADIAELNKMLNQKQFDQGSVILADKNFGCGSSREQAASCLKGHDLIIVARDFARIFLQNSINLGLKTIICPDIEADQGDELDLRPDFVTNTRTGKSFKIIAHSPTQQAIIEAGGLIEFTRNELLKRNKI